MICPRLRMERVDGSHLEGKRGRNTARNYHFLVSVPGTRQRGVIWRQARRERCKKLSAVGPRVWKGLNGNALEGERGRGSAKGYRLRVCGPGGQRTEFMDAGTGFEQVRETICLRANGPVFAQMIILWPAQAADPGKWQPWTLLPGSNRCKNLFFNHLQARTAAKIHFVGRYGRSLG